MYTGIFRTQGVILTKAALRLLGLPGGPVRLPLVDATEDQVEVLKDDLAGLLAGARMSHPHPEPAAPPPLPAGGLRVVALGGLGEIGRNMTVFEYAGRLLVVDCGVLFPEEEQPGVDLILPDFSCDPGRLDESRRVVLTHGHEDHIGGCRTCCGSGATCRSSAPVHAGAARGQAARAPDHPSR